MSGDRIRIIQGSLGCFALGVWGLIPVLGLPLAMVAIWRFFKVRHAVAEDWNPASAYLDWGFRFAGVGLLVSLLAFAAAIVQLVS